MKVFVFTLVLIFSVAAPAFSRDPACANHEGISNYNPFGGRALNTLHKCVRLYCSPQTKDSSTPDNIKVMDETLTNYRSEVKKYGELLGSYQKVCQRLVKNFCQDCPDIREFRKYHLSIDLKAAEIEDIEASISQFNPFIESIRAREGDAACTTQIVSAIKDSKGTKDGIAERFSHTKCQP